MTRYSESPKSRDYLLAAAYQAFLSLDTAQEDAQAQVLCRGLYWYQGGDEGTLVTFFRPTGITYEDRPGNIEKLRYRIGNSKNRFSIEVRRIGQGAGGIEVFTHKITKQGKPTSRMSLLVDTTWDILRIGKEIGSVGWFPRELSKHYRPLLADYPYSFTHYALNGFGDSVPSIFLCLVIQGIDIGRMVPLKDDLIRDYEMVWNRTNLSRWSGIALQEAWVIPTGYTGQVVAE